MTDSNTDKSVLQKLFFFFILDVILAVNASLMIAQPTHMQRTDSFDTLATSRVKSNGV